MDRRTADLHTRRAPNGVLVTSEVPFLEDKWWDHPMLHLFYSYPSWTVTILNEFGISKPKKVFNRIFKR